MTNEYIYIRTSTLQEQNNIFKYGYTTNYTSRLTSVLTEHSGKSYYTHLFKIKRSINYNLPYREYDKIFSTFSRNKDYIKHYENVTNVKLKYLTQLNQYLYNNNGGTEFINKEGIKILINIINNEFKLFGLIVDKVFSQNEIDLINEETYKKFNENKQIENSDNFLIWNFRDYQLTAIKKSIELLHQYNKYYLHLATGGGKIYIVYKILNEIQHDKIIILTPRIQITKQNINTKYLNILTKKYNIVDFTENKIQKINSTKNNIIISCIQSYTKVKKFIKLHNLKKNIIWFDEAHYIIENWVNDFNNYNIKYPDNDKLDYNKNKLFFIQNSKYINYRIFTSASPTKHLVELNKTIYGPLYNPISVSKLIERNYLSPIESRIYCNKSDNISILKYMLLNFTNLNKQYGFSFHSLQQNACNMFYSHYEMFKNNIMIDEECKIFQIINLQILKHTKILKIQLLILFKNIQWGTIFI